jgi:myo-inositol-1(or 4)-monophosphatase
MGRRTLHEYTLATHNYLYQSFKEEIHTAFPDHSISQDAKELQERSSITWVLQPLDGDTNFQRSLQNYCAVIGIFDGETLQHSIIYDYLQDEEYYATRDETAMINQNRLRVSKVEMLSDGVVALAESTESDAPRVGSLFHLHELLSPAVRHLRVSGSMGMDIAQVARGRIDALIATAIPSDPVPQCTALLIREAGGFVTTTPSQYGSDAILVAGNPKLTRTLRALLKDDESLSEQPLGLLSRSPNRQVENSNES